MSKRAIRTAQVVSVESLTPNLRRVILEGAQLASFPPGFEAGYVKLLLPDPDAPHDAERVLGRSYTVRAFDASRHRLTLELADHAPRGPATRWAHDARIGDSLTFAGPGPVKGVDPSCDAFLLVGDMSALPAIAAILEGLRRDALGHAIIAIPTAEDMQSLHAPEGILVHWLVEADTRASRERLVHAVEALTWPSGRVGAWVACELSAMRALREHLRQVRRIHARDMYISSYWKSGASDEEHKADKARDAELDALGAASA